MPWAQTVKGIIEAGQLGVILPHEHILCDAQSSFFFEPLNPAEMQLAYEPVTLDNLAWIRAHALNNLDCLKMPEVDILVKELSEYRKAGGCTIVDVSTKPLGGDNPLKLLHLADLTGLNIIMGCGFYKSDLPQVSTATEKKIGMELIKDLTEGIGDSTICAGIIGEISITRKLAPLEIKLLRACAIAQSETGAPIAIHPPGLDYTLINKILNILEESGGIAEKTIICHVDIMGLPDIENIKRLIDTGCNVEFDTFGHLFPPFVVPGGVMDFPGDGQRVRAIKQLVDMGYASQILISHDTFLKVLLRSYGGFGYAHILQNIVPVMLSYGIQQSDIEAMLHNNPTRLLAYLN